VIAALLLALLAYAQAGYALLLAALARVLPTRPLPGPPADDAALPRVALVIAAHDEEDVIADKVADALAQDYPPGRLEVVVASDGSTDATVRRARDAGAHRVLDLPRGGKVRAQDAAVAATDAELYAFSDANATWEPGALRALVAPFADPRVGYATGHVTFTSADGATNQEGLYWRLELALRARESALHSVTAGNGAIYAVRRAAYLRVDPRVSHDLSLPVALVRRGWRAVDVPAARARERMVPSVEGEWRRKRRMMAHAWPMIARGGLLDPRGLPPRYGLMVLSHRGLRYAAPFLHLALLAASARRPPLLAPQLALLLAAALAGRRRGRLLLLARYYVLTQASIVAGAADWLRHGTTPEWERAEGTR
jgi:cellulose synthase/poly-beta-1,6-N-acetylglucosamine synthase-like glycosyltransferase